MILKCSLNVLDLCNLKSVGCILIYYRELPIQDVLKVPFIESVLSLHAQSCYAQSCFKQKK